MKQILFLDDERTIYDVTWVDYKAFEGAYVINLKSAARMIGYIKRYGKFFDWDNTLLSIDHDLQEFDDKTQEESTGYTFIKWLIDYFVDNDISLSKLHVVVHSKNPVGRENIEKYISNAKLHFLEF